MRGVIMETKNGRAVLLTKGGGFVSIRDKGYSIGDKVNITPNAGRLCAMAASFLVVCAGIGSYFVPAGYVSVDINPSLMMTLNPYNRVIAVETFNDDARTLLSKTDIKGKGAEKSVELLIKASEEIGYINDNNRDVILEVVPGIIKPNMEKIQHGNIELTNELADRETLRRAQNIGVSMAKVKAIEEYTEKNGGDILSNAAKFNDKSAKEMRAIIRDNGHLSDKKESEASARERKAEDIVETPKPQQNKHQDYKPTKNTSVRAENKTPQTSPVLNKLPIWDIESVHTDNTPTVNQPNGKEEKPKGEAFEQNKPNRGDSGSTEKLPQTPEKKPDSSANQGNPQPSVPKHEETPQGNSKPSGTGGKEASSQSKPSEPDTSTHDNDSKNQSQTPEKKPDGSENQGNPQPSVPKHEETPPQGNSKPNETDGNGASSQSKPSEPDTSTHDNNGKNQSQTPEKKPDSSEKLPQTPEKKPENSANQGNPQPSVPKHEETPPQGETKGEAPKQSEPQNNGGNPPPNKNTGGHNEHKEMQ